MNRNRLIEGLKTLEHQVVENIESLDRTRLKLVQLVENGLSSKEEIKAVIQPLERDLTQLRDAYQNVILKTALLANIDGGDDQKGQV